MRVEEELKRKRAELLGEADELAQRIETIRKQVSAIDQVIAIYDPTHAAPTAPRTDRKRSRHEVQLPIELAQLNKTAAILEVLREAGEPLSTADCTSRIAAKHGVAADNLAPPRFLTHVSAGLNSLVSATASDRSAWSTAGSTFGRLQYSVEQSLFGWLRRARWTTSSQESGAGNGSPLTIRSGKSVMGIGLKE